MDTHNDPCFQYDKHKKRKKGRLFEKSKRRADKLVLTLYNNSTYGVCESIPETIPLYKYLCYFNETKGRNENNF